VADSGSIENEAPRLDDGGSSVSLGAGHPLAIAVAGAAKAVVPREALPTAVAPSPAIEAPRNSRRFSPPPSPGSASGIDGAFFWSSLFIGTPVIVFAALGD
jgi:hypothetical protein